MLGLKDFIHLPAVDDLFEQIAHSGPGVVVVAGLEPRSLVLPLRERALPSSGRGTIFGILARQALLANPDRRAAIVAENKDAVRIPRSLRTQAPLLLANPPQTLGSLTRQVMASRVKLLVLERLDAETAPLAFQAAGNGMSVLTPLDTIFRGRAVALQLTELGVSSDLLRWLSWVVAVTRLPTLCPNCRQPDSPTRPALARILRRYPRVAEHASFFRQGHCDECNQSGRKGDVAAFDIFQAEPGPESLSDGSPMLSLEEYTLGLAAQGLLPAEDLLDLEARLLQRTYHLLAASEEALAETNAEKSKQVTELEVANRVLQKQTEAAITLEEMSQALITYTDLSDLASYVCRKAGELCGADRAILYLHRSDDTAEIIAVNGWESDLLWQRLTSDEVLNAGGPSATLGTFDPTPFQGWPPGIAPRVGDLVGFKLRAGLRVPLVSQKEVVGLLIFHSTVKQSWSPREVALLRAFANTSALAIQRAGLFDSLRDKIARLEAAQATIARQERLGRELELARQVQQSMLPHIFPLAPGFRFAARSEPARQVGGDFYDVFLLDGNRVGIVIADVSDKGMPAALFMALTRSLILAEARRELSPYLVLQRVHRLLRELSQSEQFVTVVYGVLDGTARTLTYVRAGHDYPLLLRAGRAELLQGRGSVLGVLDDADLNLSEEKIGLEAGDRLVLYTDGLSDALASTGQAFGRERLIKLLQASAQLPLESMCDAVFRELKSFQGATEQYDDMTLLVVQVE